MKHSFLDKLAYNISAKSRSRKHQFFLDALLPTPKETIIDVGVNAIEYSDTDNYLLRFYEYPENITAVSLDDISALKEKYPKVTLLQADGTRLPFEANHFDIAFSNAVIEHVGDREAQQQFLSELIRVSKKGYITTPNRYFPFEVHTRTPLLHIILPKQAFDTFLRMIGKSWAAGDYMNLLSTRELTSLAKSAGLRDFYLHKNKLFGFTMTLTLIWKNHEN